MKSMKFGRLPAMFALAIVPMLAVTGTAGARGRMPAATTDCILRLESVDETGNLNMLMCDEAVSWIWANSGSNYEEKKPVTNHIANVQVLGNQFTLVRVFDANGSVISEEQVRVPYSANGTIYTVRGSGEAGQPVEYLEAAPDGWAGTTSDPSAESVAAAEKLVADYNESLSPAGDWRLGTIDENGSLLTNESSALKVTLNEGDHEATYWSSDTPEGTSRFVRPIRSFTLMPDGSLERMVAVDDTKTTAAEDGSNLLVRGVPVLLILLVGGGAVAARRRRKV